MTKQFSPKLYQKFDSMGKRVALDFLMSTGLFDLEVPIEKQPEEFKKNDFYIRLKKTGEIRLVEAEVKNVWEREGVWETDEWDTVDYPDRKSASKSDYFVTSNAKGNTIWIFKGDEVRNSPLKPKNTYNKVSKQRTKREPFFKVPLSKGAMFHKENGIWKRVK